MDLEGVSGLLFGRGLRLPLAAWIWSQTDHTPFYQQQAADGIGSKAQYMRREFELLCELEMIAPVPKGPGEIRQLYVADPDQPLWSIVETAVQVIER